MIPANPANIPEDKIKLTTDLAAQAAATAKVNADIAQLETDATAALTQIATENSELTTDAATIAADSAEILALTITPPVWPAVPTPQTIPSGLTHTAAPSSNLPPVMMAENLNYMNIFAVGQPVIISTVPQPQNPFVAPIAINATSWDCTDIYGNVISGTINGATITIAPNSGNFPCGWYLVRFFANNIQVADTTFLVWNDNVANLPTISSLPNGLNPNYGNPANWLEAYGDPIYALAASVGITPGRFAITNAANPTSTSGASSDPGQIGDGDTNLTACIAGAQLDQQWRFKYQTINRPYSEFCEFPNGISDTGALAGVTQSVTELEGLVEWFEGPSNEPQGLSPTVVAGQMVSFAAAVRAGNPNAKVMGPGIVTFNGSETSWLTQFFAALPAGTLDGISIHGYNTVNGDLILGDRCLSGLQNIIATAGLSHLPIWMTETGEFYNNYGSMNWRTATHWTAMRTLLYEAYGIPKERQAYFYNSSHGFSFPSYITAARPSVSPAITFFRGLSEQTSNATLRCRLAMPNAVANRMALGLVYDSSINTIVTLLANGFPTGTATLNIGNSTANVYDWAGNLVSTLTSVNGLITVSIGDLPVYVQLVAGTVVYVTDINNGLTECTNDLALTAIVHSSSTLSTISQINNGQFEDGFYYGNGGLIGLAPLRDIVAPPAWFGLVWSSTQQIKRAIFTAPIPWQFQDAPLSFTVSAWIENAWVNQYTYLSSSGISQAFNSVSWPATAENFWNGQSTFDIPLNVSTNAILVTVSEVSWGDAPDQLAATASYNYGSTPAMCVTEFEVY